MNLEAQLTPTVPPKPPVVVLEQPAPCAESAETAAGLFSGALPVTSSDPLAGWMIRVRVASVGHPLDHDGAPMLRADGELFDGRGVSIAHRSFTNRGTACAPLAKAIGVWASLTLDDERAKVEALPETKTVVAAPLSTHRKKHDPASGEEDDVDPDLQPNRPPAVETTRELGVASILEGGIGSRPLFGPAVYGVMEIGKGFLLRPTIAIDGSFTESPELHAGTRVDLCGRLRGNYHAQRGLDAEFCLGSEMGFLRTDLGTIPLLGVGPALGLQGELASNFAVTLRGIGEINLLRDSLGTVQPQTLAGRVELGMTWKLQ
ncbi:MAG: hypothetical protein ABI461_22650 [Polyangiaceae bacterium]